jgi:hypothetical protein
MPQESTPSDNLHHMGASAPPEEMSLQSTPITASLVSGANRQFSATSHSDWYNRVSSQQAASHAKIMGELTIFEASGYQNLSVLQSETPGKNRGGTRRRLRSIGKKAVTQETLPTPLSEQQRNLNGQLVLPENAEIDEGLSNEETVIRKFRLGSAEVLVASPRSGVLREDPETDKPLDPMLLVLGINGDSKYPWATMAFSQGGEELPPGGQAHAGRNMIGIRYPNKLEGKMKTRVALGKDHAMTVPEFDMIQAQNILTALKTLQAKRVDITTESRGNKVNTIAMELARQEGTMSMLGDVLNISPTGLGGESSARSHEGAAAIAIHGLYRSLLFKEKLDPLARRLKGSGIVPGGRFFRDPLGWRREQVSVAESAEDNLPEVLARVNADPGRKERRDTVYHTYDPLDPAIRKKSLERHNVGEIPIKQTKFYGHAIPYGRRGAVRWIDNHFQEVRNDRTQYSQAA